jgi:hypothetical protein
LIKEDIKRRLNSGNALYHLVQNLILPLFLYGCETWSPSLREEHRLRVFKDKVLRRIFGMRRDEVTGRWRKLHNEEIHNLHLSSIII